jgi:hypothetical protein
LFPLFASSLLYWQGTEVFYTTATRTLVLPAFDAAFPRLLRAAAARTPLGDDASPNTVFLVFGVCVRALCGRIDDAAAVDVLTALETLVRVHSQTIGCWAVLGVGVL